MTQVSENVCDLQSILQSQSASRVGVFCDSVDSSRQVSLIQNLYTAYCGLIEQKQSCLLNEDIELVGIVDPTDSATRNALTHLTQPTQSEQQLKLNIIQGNIFNHPFQFENSSCMQDVDPENAGFDIIFLFPEQLLRAIDPAAGLALALDSMRQALKLGGIFICTGEIVFQDVVNATICKKLERQIQRWLLDCGFSLHTASVEFRSEKSVQISLLVQRPATPAVRVGNSLMGVDVKRACRAVVHVVTDRKLRRFMGPLSRVLHDAGVEVVDGIRNSDGISHVTNQSAKGKCIALFKVDGSCHQDQQQTCLELEKVCKPIDTFQSALSFTSRPVMLARLNQAIASGMLCYSNAQFTMPRAGLLHAPFATEEYAAAWLKQAALSLPVVVKPLDADQHSPFWIAHSLADLTMQCKLEFPCPAVVQQVSSHLVKSASASMYKIGVIGQSFAVSERASINTTLSHNETTTADSAVEIGRISKHAPQSGHSEPIDDDTMDIFSKASHDLQQCIGLSLFNFDAIETEESTPENRVFCIVDVNYWPGFSETPNKISLFVSEIVRAAVTPGNLHALTVSRQAYAKASSHSLPRGRLSAVVTPPTCPIWHLCRSVQQHPSPKPIDVDLVSLSYRLTQISPTAQTEKVSTNEQESVWQRRTYDDHTFVTVPLVEAKSKSQNSESHDIDNSQVQQEKDVSSSSSGWTTMSKIAAAAGAVALAAFVVHRMNKSS